MNADAAGLAQAIILREAWPRPRTRSSYLLRHGQRLAHFKELELPRATGQLVARRQTASSRWC